MKITNPSGLTNSIGAWRDFPFSRMGFGGLRVRDRAHARRFTRGALLSTYLLATWACQVALPPKETIWVTIPPDAPLEEVTDSLAANGIIQSPQAFQRLARMGRAHLGIKPGLYDFRPHSPIGAVLARLRKGTAPVKRFVLPKGIWLTELAARLERDTGLDREVFIAAASSPVLLSRLGTRGRSAEGYLYPAVYHLREGATAQEIIDQVTDTFEAHWNSEWDRRSASLGFTRDEVVTLASIIEGEGPAQQDLLQISSVYHNRLNRGMRLQADPTVVFALGRRRRLLNRDYATDSPFNTYHISGLPPSPIGSPSSASIEAALYPDSTDFLYFVARPDGRHRFSVTFEQHIQAIGEIRKEEGGPGRRD